MVMRARVVLLLSLAIVLTATFVEGQTKKKSGEEIADSLYKHPDECKDPSDGGIWAPLAPGHSCGAPGHDCKYPDEWCSAKSSSKSVPKFTCIKLPAECKKALAKEDGGAATADDESTTTAKPTTAKSAGKTNSGTTKATAAAGTNAKTTVKPKTSAHPTKVTKTTKATTTTTEEPTKAPAKKTTTAVKEESGESGGTRERTEESVTTTEQQADSSEEAVTVVTRRPRPFQKGEPKPRKEETDAGAAGASVPAPAPPAPAETCTDGHPFCCFWASNTHAFGTECDRNALWMRTTCQKSCGTCGCTASTFQTCRVNVNVQGCQFLQGDSSSPVFVPVNNGGAGGGGVFAFPTAGGGTGLQGGFGGAPGGQQNNPLFVPVGNPNNGPVFPPNAGGRPPVIVRAGR